LGELGVSDIALMDECRSSGHRIGDQSDRLPVFLVADEGRIRAHRVIAADDEMSAAAQEVDAVRRVKLVRAMRVGGSLLSTPIYTKDSAGLQHAFPAEESSVAAAEQDVNKQKRRDESPDERVSKACYAAQ